MQDVTKGGVTESSSSTKGDGFLGEESEVIAAQTLSHVFWTRAEQSGLCDDKKCKATCIKVFSSPQKLAFGFLGRGGARERVQLSPVFWAKAEQSGLCDGREGFYCPGIQNLQI